MNPSIQFTPALLPLHSCVTPLQLAELGRRKKNSQIVVVQCAIEMNNQLTITERFDGAPVEFNPGDAFVNLTSMCSAFEKRPNDFLALPTTVSFIAALSECAVKLPENLVVKKEGRNGGTWAHPDLALECARWLAPRFAIWCNQMIRSILSTKQEQPAKFALPANYKEALEALLVEVTAREALQLENATMAPKAEFFDAVTASDDTLDLNRTAKLIGVGRNKLMQAMRRDGILMENNTPYQEYIDREYFRVVESKWVNPKDGTSHVTLTTRVYQTGVDFLRRKFTTGAAK